MNTYLGAQLVQAERQQMDGKDGYKAIYSDKTFSWVPANVFEATYIATVANPHMPTDAPSISQEMVDHFIAHTEVMTIGDKNTVVRAVLKNGFELVESSACVSAENYSEDLGAKICMRKIKDRVWYLLGFLLQTAVHGIKEDT